MPANDKPVPLAPRVIRSGKAPSALTGATVALIGVASARVHAGPGTHSDAGYARAWNRKRMVRGRRAAEPDGRVANFACAPRAAAVAGVGGPADSDSRVTAVGDAYVATHPPLERARGAGLVGYVDLVPSIVAGADDGPMRHIAIMTPAYAPPALHHRRLGFRQGVIRLLVPWGGIGGARLGLPFALA